MLKKIERERLIGSDVATCICIDGLSLHARGRRVLRMMMTDQQIRIAYTIRRVRVERNVADSALSTWRRAVIGSQCEILHILNVADTVREAHKLLVMHVNTF